MIRFKTERFYFHFANNLTTIIQYQSRKRWEEPNGTRTKGEGGGKTEPGPASNQVQIFLTMPWLDRFNMHTNLYYKTGIEGYIFHNYNYLIIYVLSNLHLNGNITI